MTEKRSLWEGEEKEEARKERVGRRGGGRGERVVCGEEETEKRQKSNHQMSFRWKEKFEVNVSR